MVQLMKLTKVDKIRSLLKSIETGEPGPISIVNEARYIQHNPQTHEGSEGLASLFKRLSKTEPTVNMVRGFQDGEFVFAHMEYDFSSRKICFEVFRFEQDRAVEHWDNIQERLGPNASGRSMVDGPTEATGREHTEANRAVVQEFVESVLIEDQTDRLREFINENDYSEHNPHLDDDVEVLEAALTASDDAGLIINYRKLHRVLADGNFVLSVCEGTRSGVHSAFYDLFRLDGGKIVEHWDTTERVAPKEEWKNTNGKF